MLTHYRELLRQFSSTILATSLVAGLTALAFSLLLLRVMSIYESSVTLNMQPSTEDLQFNSAFLGVSQFNPATIIAQTHIERILSRPVMERAVEIVIEKSGGGSLAEEPSAFDRFRIAVFRWIRILNSGFFVPPTEMEGYINDLKDATSVEIVEGSYILLVTVSHTDPVIAARAANALAMAYVELAQADLQNDADEVDRSLNVVLERIEALLMQLIEERSAFGRDLGVMDIDAERTSLLASRSAARSALQETRISLAENRTRLEGLESSAPDEGDADLARQQRQRLAEIRASLAATEAELVERRANLAEAERAMRDLDAAQNAMAEVDQRISAVEADLFELQQRRIRTDLAREARLSQVRTISEAQIPVYPSSPKVMTNTIAGLIVGAILAFVPILGIDALGDRIRTSIDLKGSFGQRILPALRPRLVRDARRYLNDGARPTRALQRFADQVGRRFAVEGGGQTRALSTINVTATGTEAQVDSVGVVMRAVMGILSRSKADGSPVDVDLLPPLSRIADWNVDDERRIVIGVVAGQASKSEFDSFAFADGKTNGSEIFALLVL